MNLPEFLALLETAGDRIDRATAALLTECADDLTAYARSIEHVQSGNMQGSTTRLGPFPAGDGLECQIVSGAWYAGREVARGGAHDWPARTIAESQARILQLELEAAGAVVKALTGRG